MTWLLRREQVSCSILSQEKILYLKSEKRLFFTKSHHIKGMIRAFFGSRVCCAIAKTKKKNSFTRTKSIYKGSLRTHRSIISAAFKEEEEEEEEEDMSS